MQEEQNWILVEKESDIKVGSTYKFEPCMVCECRHVITITRYLGIKEWNERDSRGNVTACRTPTHSWQVTTPCNKEVSLEYKYLVCVDYAIHEKRLYRLDTGLKDEDLQQEGRDIYNSSPVKKKQDA